MIKSVSETSESTLPLWPALSLWHTLLLALPCGIVAGRFFWPGFFAVFLLTLLGLPLLSNACSKERFCHPSIHPLKALHDKLGLAVGWVLAGRLGIMAALFACGFLLGRSTLAPPEITPEQPPVPLWAMKLLEQANPAFRQERGQEKGQELAFKVDSVTGLYGGRVRLILSEVQPWKALRETDAPETPPILPHKAVLTLRGPQALATQALPPAGHWGRAKLRLRKQASFKNIDLPSFDEYWRGRGVGFRLLQSKDSTGLRPLNESETQVMEGLPESDRYSSDNFLLGLARFKRAAHHLRQQLMDNFFKALPVAHSDARGILYALLSGDRRHISQESADLFSRASLAHSLALSGMHLGLASLLGGFVALALGRVWPSIYLYLPRLKLAALCGLPFAALYLWLGDFSISLLRAGLMLAVGAAMLLMGRARRVEDLIISALLIICLFQPALLFELSLQLSIISVASIALFLPPSAALSKSLITRMIRPCQNHQSTPEKNPAKYFRESRGSRLMRWLMNVLLVSFFIQITLMPLSLRYFGEVPLWFPLNLIWLPILGAVVLPLDFLGFLSANLGLNNLAAIALQLALWPCEGLLWLLNALDSWFYAPAGLRPLWPGIVGFWGLLLCMVSLWRSGWRKHNALALALCCALVLWPVLLRHWPWPRPEIRLSLFDVGQGQALYLEVLNKRIICDGGGLPGASFDVGRGLLGPALSLNAPPHLNMVINTHPDHDHLGGLFYLLEYFRVEHFVASLLPEEASKRASLEELLQYQGNWWNQGQQGLTPEFPRQGEEIFLGEGVDGGYYLEVLHPNQKQSQEQDQESALKHPNDNSLVLRLAREDKLKDGQRIGLLLIMGDLQRPGIKALLDSGQDLRAEVLLLPHHGAASSLSNELYRAVAPRLALAAAGRDNQWGFPSLAVRQAMQNQGIELRSTAQEGEIRLSWSSLLR